VSAVAAARTPVGIGATKPIGSLQYDFLIPGQATDTQEPYDVGTLMLEAAHQKSR
jgi:hypothetical protein